ncbi:MAG: terpene cyclase/mutase family protein [Spirochaetales bacterium]|nr:terpene cyclase/mutase family protein [Spirochaetales bacterium]
MKNNIMKITIITLLFTIFFFACTGKTGDTKQGVNNNDQSYKFPLSLKKEAEHSLELAYKFLQKNQFKDGSWKSHPAITSLVLYSLVEVPGYIQIDNLDDTIKKGFTYLEGFVKEDGGIYQNEYRNYTTAVALLAFSTYGQKEHKDIIENAKEFLIRFQCDESEGYTEKDPYYGGIGYGGDERPDLSNTQLALEAIKSADDYEEKYSKLISENAENMETEGTDTGLYWKKALIFLARCQNVKEVNSMDYRTEDDGGFMYETGTYTDDRSHSYGSMTYAGVKSLLYAKVDRNDIRITKGVDWIKNNYTVEENPKFGTTSLYYYYMTFSKCLYILGDNVITDANGNKHFWREDITKKLISLQNENGYWMNDDGRYWENIKDLATAYSVAALKYAFKGLESTDIK